MTWTIKVPEVRPQVVNEVDLVAQMTNTLAGRIRERTKRGEALSGRLPTGKTGGPPLGSLPDSIGGRTRVTKRGAIIGTVTALGERSEAEQASIQKKAARARERTRALRAAAVLGAALQATARGDAFNRGARVKLSKLRLRTVTNNASLAAILSTEPRDARARAGNRGVYRVFGVRSEENAELGRLAQNNIEVRLVKTGERVVEVK